MLTTEMLCRQLEREGQAQKDNRNGSSASSQPRTPPLQEWLPVRPGSRLARPRDSNRLSDVQVERGWEGGLSSTQWDMNPLDFFGEKDLSHRERNAMV